MAFHVVSMLCYIDCPENNLPFLFKF